MKLKQGQMLQQERELSRRLANELSRVTMKEIKKKTFGAQEL